MFLHKYQELFCSIYRSCYIFLPNVMDTRLLMANYTVSLIFNRSLLFLLFFFSLSCNLENQVSVLFSEHS